MAAENSSGEDKAPLKKKRSWTRRLRVVLLFAGPLVLVGIGLWYYISHQGLVSTEDAFIRHNTVTISSQVAGRVIAVPVHTNETVSEGTVLFKIDSAPFEASVKAAQAHLSSVAMQVASLKAKYKTVAAKIDGAKTHAAYLKREVDRLAPLAKQNVVTHAKVDKARTELQQAQHKVSALKAQQAEILARLDGDPEQPLDENADYQAATAALITAKLNLSYTVVRAPAAGQLGTVAILPGDVMSTGKAAMPLVESGQQWVKANFKETALTHMRVGDPATISVGSYPNHTWHGQVESISPASGAISSLLPPQNATGNWVKVVQRIPVRITINTDDDAPPLRSGMSATVTVNVQAGKNNTAQ